MTSMMRFVRGAGLATALIAGPEQSFEQCDARARQFERSMRHET